MEQKACGQNDERQLDDDRGGTTIKWVVGKAIKRLERERGLAIREEKQKKPTAKKKRTTVGRFGGGERRERRGGNNREAIKRRFE